MMSKAIRNYFDALERLKANKPQRVAKGTPINRDTVATEAGRTRGSIRPRAGLEELIEAIDSATLAKHKQRSKRDPDKKLAAREAEIEALKSENDILKTRYMSLLYLNYEMASKLKGLEEKLPTMGRVIEIDIYDSTDPYHSMEKSDV